MWLGIDLGTSSVKAGIFDEAGMLQWVGEEPYEPALSADRAEIDPEVWWTRTRTAIRRAPREIRAQVEGVGFSGQMHGLVLVDEDNQPVRDAILWPDRRAIEHLGPFSLIENRNPGCLGNPIVPGMPGPVLLWLREHEPSLWRSRLRIMSPKDWVRSRMTGEESVVTDHSDASATLMYDTRRNNWSLDVASLLEIDETMLAPIGDSFAVAGTLTASVSRELGLRPDLVVAVGAGDTAAALLGLGIRTPGTILLNVGTGGQAMSVVAEPNHTRPAHGFHQYRTANDDSTWYVMAAVLNCGLALGWVRSVLEMDWDVLFSHAGDALTTTFDDPVFAPFLAGERDPQVGLDRRGSWTDLGIAHDRAALARSALVGTASYLARRTRALADATQTTRVVMSGGSMRSLEWAHLMATMLGCEVDLSLDAHASVRGAAVTAANAGGADIPIVPSLSHIEPTPSQADLAAAALARLDVLIAAT